MSVNSKNAAACLRSRVLRGEAAFGPMVIEFFTPGIASISEAAGADFILYDMEHSGIGIAEIKAQCAATRGLSLTPMVRVPAGDYHFVARALDAGARGVMVPMVETADQARAIAAAAHYPPVGRRGAAFGVAHDGYLSGAPKDKIATAEAETLVIAQIETAAGLAAIEEIAAVPGIDVLWLGHFDMTNFLGIPGEFDHPLYKEAVQRVLEAAKAHGKVTGFMAVDETWARDYQALGFQMIAYGLDMHLYQTALAKGLTLLKGAQGG